VNSQPILIVDDEDEVRATLLEALDCQGFTVEAVASAEEALQALARHPFAVVVTDLHMPGGQTGLELIAVIRHRYPETLPILITAYATLDTSIDALKKGAYDLIQKPFRLAELEVVLNRALDHAHLLSQLRAYQEELEGRIRSRTRDLQEVHQQALALCDISLRALETRTTAPALDTLLDRLTARWAPDGLACYRHQADGRQHRLATRGSRPLPEILDRPDPGPLSSPRFGYTEEFLVPLGSTGWLYLGFEHRSAFTEQDSDFLLLARHLELVLLVE
jgi:CheY-like chemotaxis protein